MYSLILKMQLKRIWIPYLAISILFIAGFLFVPFIFTLNMFNLFFLALMSGIALALAHWSFPKNYLATLPVKINSCRMALHVTPIILTALPTLVLILCFAFGLKGFMLGKLHGNELFDNFKYLQTELLFLGLFFQLIALQVTYFAMILYESNWSRLTLKKGASSELYTILNSYPAAFVILILFALAPDLSVLLLLTGSMLALSLFLPYINPFRRDIIIDSHITGGTYTPDRKKLFFYSLTWGLIILLLSISFFSVMSMMLELKIVSDIFSFTVPALIIAYAAISINTFIRERQTGTTMIKSMLSATAGILFPPLLPFIYSYRLRNTPRLKSLLNKYYKKHGPPQAGQVIDYKEIYKTSQKNIAIFLFIFIAIFLGFNGTFVRYDKGPKTTKIESNPSGLEVSFYNEKVKETVAVTTPGEIKLKTANVGWHDIKVPGFKLIEENWSFLYEKLTLDFVSDKEMEKLQRTLREIKATGNAREQLLKALPPDELFTMIKFFTGVCNSKDFTFNSVSGIFFTQSGYENILDTMINSYVSKLSEQQAAEQIQAMINEDELRGNTFSTHSDYFKEYKVKLFQSIVSRFESLRKEYRNKIIANPYGLLGLNSVLEDFLFNAFSKYPDKELTEVAFMNISNTFYFMNTTNNMYGKYLFRTQKDSANYNLIANEAIKTSRTMHDAYSPLEFIASSGAPQALEEIKTRLKKDSKRDSLYQVIVKSYPPEEAFSFINTIETDPSVKDKAFCFLKTPQVTEYFQKKGDEVLKDKRLLENIGASQNEYLFPVLVSMKSNYDKITETICKFDGKLTEMWVGYMRKEGEAKNKELLEKTLKDNASCFQKKQN